MNYSEKQIEDFMSLGDPKEKLFLRWYGRESFCDDAVQEVLLKMHPDNLAYPDERLRALPIHAWRITDSISLIPTEANWNEFFPYMAHRFPFMPLRRVWMVELLNATVTYRETERQSKPDTTLAEIKAWRNDRYPLETSKIDKPLPPPIGWMEDKDRSVSPSAYRQAVKRENDRRDRIMHRWAECWLAYLSIAPVTQTGQKCNAR